MIKRIIGFVIFFIAVSGYIYCQSVDKIIEKVFDARGRGKSIENINTIKISGKLIYSRVTGTFVAYNKKPFLNRFEFELMGKRVIQAINLTGGWYINEISDQYDAISMTKEVFEQTKYQNYYPIHPLFDYKSKGIKLRLIGKDTTQGRLCYVIREILPDSSKTDMYVDTVSFLQLLQKTIVRMPESKDLLLETYFKDYRNVNGLMIPYIMEKTNNGVLQTKMIIEKAEVNIPIDDSVFNPPANKSENKPE